MPASADTKKPDMRNSMFKSKCPLCGTHGKVWENETEPEVFKCPNCASIFSEFGVIMDSEKEHGDFWN
ncbi:MAG: hypothetical protein HY518_05125 [Candidatus Aenigmarchaeota archaeon]|nr:hypothetical protein [Candidatus Aenigmarchaeota archaeon]